MAADRLPLPEDPETERSLVSCVWAGLRDHDGDAARALGEVGPDAFLVPQARSLWTALRGLYGRGEATDPALIHGELKRLKLDGTLGGYAGVMEALSFNEWGNPEPLVRRVVELDNRRRMVALAGELDRKARDLVVEPTQAIGEVSTGLMALSLGASVARRRSGLDLLERLKARKPFRDPSQGQKLFWFPFEQWNEAVECAPGHVIIVGAAAKTGKCLGKGTPVMMHNTSIIPVEQVKNGDLVMGPDGGPRTVTGVASGREEMFRIIPAMGDPWTCNASHILSVIPKHGPYGIEKHGFVPGEPALVSVRNYMDLPFQARRGLRLWRAPLNWDAMATDLDPYLVGLWLGDGSFRKPEVTTIDAEIAEFLEHQGFRRVDNKGRCPSYKFTTARGKVNPIWESLKECRVGGEKRIPRAYLLNDRPTRLALLAGIVDSDGHLDPRKKARLEIITKHAGLRDDILFLARSLGFCVTCVPKKSGIKTTGFKGSYWRIAVSGEVSEIPTKLPRKQAPERTLKYPAYHTGFKVEPIGEGDYYGFELDGDHLYLLGDFTVTHNTALVIDSMVHTADKGGIGGLVSLEMDNDEVDSRFAARMTSYDSRKFLREEWGYHVVETAVNRHASAFERLHWWCHPSGVAWARVEAEIREMVRLSGVRAVVIDYFTLIQKPTGSKSASDASLWGYLSTAIKRLAQELRICIVLLCQLNREGAEGEPHKWHLRETGQLEQDANAICFLWKEREDGPVFGKVSDNRSGPVCPKRELLFDGATNIFKPIVGETTGRTSVPGWN